MFKDPNNIPESHHDDCMIKGIHRGGINHSVIKKHSCSLRPERVKKNLNAVKNKICLSENMLKMNCV